MSKELLILLVSISPFLELRGSIPLGEALGLNLTKVFLLSIFANISVIIPLLFFFNFLIFLGQRVALIRKIFSWWFLKIEKKRDLIDRYGFGGLFLFVAIPLPGSGAWSGALAACLFKIRFLKAFLAISLGVLIAGVLVTLGTKGIFSLGMLFKKVF